MKKYCFTAFLFLCLLTSACHKKLITQPVESIPKTEEVKVDAGADLSATGAAYRIDSIGIVGDVLFVFVNYSGGCNEHSFELISNGKYAKSLPPQLSLCLKHSNNGDMCKKLVSQELKFDISKIKYQASKALEIKLGDKSINYNY